MKFKFRAIVVVFILLFSFPAFSKGSKSGKGSGRSAHRFGLYLSVFGDPYASIISGSLGVNLGDFSRINVSSGVAYLPTTTLGYSDSFKTGKAVSTGIKFFVPGWTFSPTLGVNYEYIWADSLPIGQYYKYDLAGGSVYLNLGVDWQTRAGFYVAGGVNYSFVPGAGFFPYVNLGWFFF